MSSIVSSGNCKAALSVTTADLETETVKLLNSVITMIQHAHRLSCSKAVAW